MPHQTETWQFATQQITVLMERLEHQIHSTAQSQGPEEVHNLRVAIRRFNQSLAVFRRYLPDKPRRACRAGVKMLMKLAGPVRDSDIALKFLLKSSEPGAAELRQKVRPRRKQLAAALAAGLKRMEQRKSFLKWRASLLPAHPPESRSYALAEADARHELAGVAKKFFKAGKGSAEPKASPAEIHGFRIRAKKFRYTIELFRPLYGPQAEAWTKRLKQVQTLLGDINDCRVMRALAAELGGSEEIAESLKKRQRKKTRKFQNLWEAGYGSHARKQWIDEIQTV